MADFCNQCASGLGFPEGDLANSQAGPPEPGLGYPVLCEGCGPCLVDEKGNCVDPDCLQKHGCQDIANEIMTQFSEAMLKPWTGQLDNLPLVLLNDIAKTVCGELYVYELMQIHDSYDVKISLKAVTS